MSLIRPTANNSDRYRASLLQRLCSPGDRVVDPLFLVKLARTMVESTMVHDTLYGFHCWVLIVSTILINTIQISGSPKMEICSLVYLGVIAYHAIQGYTALHIVEDSEVLE
ncbi:hypothetical protein F4781DRAFT_338379 [Annulohypoxylon bovei var. microspora]|nr:hypothetical protein F4781DRAFT_338379 [Annulohypoxylon bovei var. microspora]